MSAPASGIVFSLQAFSRALANVLGEGWEETFSKVGIGARFLSDPSEEIGSEEANLVWREAVKITGDHVLAIKVADYFHPGYWGMIGHAVYASGTLALAIERVIRHTRRISPFMWASACSQGDKFVFSAHRSVDSMPPERSFLSVVITVKLCRDLVGAKFSPEFVRVCRFSSPLSGSQRARVIEYFGCPVVFDQDSMDIVLPMSVVSASLITANEPFAQHLDSVIEREICVRSICCDQVAEQIRAFLPVVPTLHNIAAALAISPRTLQRRLSDEGVSFSDILNDTRKTLIEDYLLHAGKSVKEVTHLTGFSNPSNFSRACKLLFGVTPNQLRTQKQHLLN